MSLPKNGRILILDDKIGQALPLMRVLSKNKTAFTFHTDDLGDLPLVPYDDIRLLFLDIDLTDGVNEAAIKAQLIAILKRLVKTGTPYMLAVWSTKETQYEQLLNQLFEIELLEIKPILKLSLRKSDFFRIEATSGNYELDPNIDVIAELEKRLRKEMAAVDVFKLLIEWENIVNKSSTDTILSFTSLIAKDEYWNNNMKHILLKMAHAQLGQNLKSSNKDDIVLAALKTLSSYLTDDVDSSLNVSRSNISDIKIKKDGTNHFKNVLGQIVKLRWEDLNTNALYINGIEKSRNKIVDNLKASNPVDEPIINNFKASYRTTSPKLNSKLLISLKKNTRLQPGNIYYKKVTGSRKRKLLGTYFKNVYSKKSGVFELKDLSSILFIEMECTPTCDYSQKKWLRSRVLPGILYPNEYHNKLNTTNDSLYTEIPSFEFRNTIVRIVFDYRLFKSINLEDDKNFPNEFLFKLKNEVLVDIQTRISAHVSRLGITTIL